MRKKNIEDSASNFTWEVTGILDFLEEVRRSDFSDLHISWCYDLAIIRLYRVFESFMLDCIIAILNNDSDTFSEVVGIDFPKHLSVSVCEYLIVGNGYFDFKGRSGLISQTRRFMPADHWFVTTLKDRKYKDALEQLCALRNFATHESTVSKNAALVAVGQDRMGSAGSWLKRQSRFESIANQLRKLAQEIRRKARQ